ncbi:MAG TPA: homoserine kinase [Jatrophihabitantaceae bacterium]|nr:homoserine kinase [Jatrophihabitantaceae bacterium]
MPHGRGLGSSAAAIVAGVLLARGLVDGGDDLLSIDDVLVIACEIEGHPDNVAACLLGGLTVAWSDARAHAVRLECDPAIKPIAFVPPFETSTSIARGLLPGTVSHADASFTAGRAALLIAALTGHGDALFAATDDRLHQAYRAPAMPQSAELMTALRASGVPAVISGAGPTVLALTRSPQEAEAARAAAPDGWRALELTVASDGALVTAVTQVPGDAPAN